MMTSGKMWSNKCEILTGKITKLLCLQVALVTGHEWLKYSSDV